MPGTVTARQREGESSPSTIDFKVILHASLLSSFAFLVIAVMLGLVITKGLDHIVSLTLVVLALGISMLGLVLAASTGCYAQCSVDRDLKLDKFDDAEEGFTKESELKPLKLTV